MIITHLEILIPPNSLNRYRKTVADIGIHDGVNIVVKGVDANNGNLYITTMNVLVKKICREEIHVYEPLTSGRYTILIEDILDITTGKYDSVPSAMHPVRAIPIAKSSRMRKALYMDNKASDRYTTNSLSASYNEIFEAMSTPYLDPVTYNGKEVALLVNVDSRFGYVSNNGASLSLVKEIPDPVLIFNKDLEPQIISSKDEILL